MYTGLPTLRISRDQLREGPVRQEGELETGADWGPAAFELIEPVRAVVTADESQGGGVRLEGTLSARVVETCGRCLKRVTRDIEVPIDVRFEPDLDPWDEAPGLYALDADREEIDAGPALREELLLALPEYPLCEPDCQGLCPSCGADWNETDCDCVEEPGDPRWESLRRQLEPDGPVADDDTNQEG